MFDIIIVGGGIAGLVNSILLSRAGLNIALFEKKDYPFHRVCGEYVSNEVKPFLIKNNLFPDQLSPSEISKFALTSTNGNKAQLPLKMGGFGISRFVFDHFLFEQAKAAGVTIFENSPVSEINFDDAEFYVETASQTYQSKFVIGAHGKRTSLDRNRDFMQKKSPYLGVKYHIKTDLPSNEIALHNFENGYCGVSQIENQSFNLCYLSHRSNLKRHKTIEQMEESILHQNPYLKNIWSSSDFLFEKPLTINEISFEKKESIHNHILMCGDTAGMIAPLCGNGMAMAIRSAKILSELIIKNWNKGNFDRNTIEQIYQKEWSNNFSSRLWAGRKIQGLFGSKWSSNLAVRLARIKPIGQSIVGLTHGKSF